MTDQVQPQVSTIKKEVIVCKELSEVFALLTKIASDVKVKKNMTQMASEDFPLLYKAIDNFQALPDEMKSKYVDHTLALGLADISRALRGDINADVQ